MRAMNCRMSTKIAFGGVIELNNPMFSVLVCLFVSTSRVFWWIVANSLNLYIVGRNSMLSDGFFDVNFDFFSCR